MLAYPYDWKRFCGSQKEDEPGLSLGLVVVPLTLALLNLPKGKSLGRSKPATNS